MEFLLTSQTLLVKAFLCMSGSIGYGGPESAAVGRQDFVDQYDFVCRLVESEFEFGVGDDDSAG